MKAAYFDPRSPEVDEKADFHSGCPQIIDHLGLMFWRERSHRFHLDQDDLVYDDVWFEVADDPTSEVDLDRLLRGNLQSVLAQGDEQSGVIHGLEKPVTELVCDLEADSDDPLRELFVRPAHLWLLRRRDCSWQEHGLSVRDASARGRRSWSRNRCAVLDLPD